MVLNFRTLSPLFLGAVELGAAVILGAAVGDLLTLLFAILLSVGLIWGSQFLGEGSFHDVPRGYPHASRPSAPVTIAIVGWIFLILLPSLVLWHLGRGSA